MESPPAFRRDPTDWSASNHSRGFSGKSVAISALDAVFVLTGFAGFFRINRIDLVNLEKNPVNPV